MGRIIDLRDPDTYISFDDYEMAVTKAKKANKQRRADLMNRINERIKPLNMEVVFDEMDTASSLRIEISIISRGKITKWAFIGIASIGRWNQKQNNTLRSILRTY